MAPSTPVQRRPKPVKRQARPGGIGKNSSIKVRNVDLRASPQQENLCPQCEKIDFDILEHPERIKTSLGLKLARLNPAEDWNMSTCDFCRLLSTIQPVPESGKDFPVLQRHYLFAYSSLKSFDPGYAHLPNSRVGAAVLLGTIPEDKLKEPQTAGQSRYANRTNYWPSFGGFITSVSPHNHPADACLRVRSVGPSLDFEVLRGWVDLCRKEHVNHQIKSKLRSFDTTNSSRLIDCRTRQIVPLEPGQDYFALSYVWGKTVPASEDNVLEGCGNALPKRVPIVVEDAMKVVEKLGFQYLWVDRYCIRQDDEQDKHNQIANMDLVYQNAQVTIIAAAGVDPDYGLPGVGNRLRAPQQEPTIISKRSLFAVPPTPTQLVQGSKWMTRAWVYQEALFSRRRLIFTDQQVYFECEHMSCRETIDTKPDLLMKRKTQQGGNKSMFSIITRTPKDIKKHISDYSQKELTYDSDILNGMLGIFRAYENADPPAHHFLGIPLLQVESYMRDRYSKHQLSSKHWTTRFLNGLQWHPSSPTSRRNGFPSWSWAGWRGPVEWLSAYFFVPDPDINISVGFQEGQGTRWGSFEEVKLREGQLDYVTPSLRVEGWIIQLRFDYLPEGPPKHWNKRTVYNRGAGYYVRLAEDPLEYSPLFLTKAVDVGDALHSKLLTDSWDCFVIGYYALGAKEAERPATVLVCEWTGDIAQRIGIVNLEVGVWDVQLKTLREHNWSQRVHFPKTWRSFRFE